MPLADLLDADACYRAAAGRDARWDGRMYLGVVTTGIYCRPSCPARTPLRRNCVFFRSAAAAVAGGFRACRRCRPDTVPGSRDWDARGDLTARAVLLIRDGVVDQVGVAGLAARLAVSERHLHRVLVAEVGATPQQLNRTRRAQTARMLVEQTALPLADVAFAAGFGSVRQFNDVMIAEYGTTPSALRRPTARPVGGDPADGQMSDVGPAVVLRLRHRPPLATAPLRRFLAAHAVAGTDRLDDATHTRVVPGARGPAIVTIEWGDAPDHVVARLQLADLADLMGVVARVRRWLDLDADPALVDGALSEDALLAPLVAARPGLRLPGATSGTETALCAVLGQQVSLGAARTFAGRLVAHLGTAAPDGLLQFPAAEAVAAAPPEELRAAIGITTARGRALQALARAVAEGLVLEPGSDRDAVRNELLALPGIGPWTADYVALRCLGDPDGYLPGDLVLKRALGVTTSTAALDRSKGWEPWRGYALMHLWTAAVFA